MLWLNKVKGSAKEVLKEHPVSVCCFFLAALSYGILDEFFSLSIYFGNVIANFAKFLSILLFVITPAFLVCECNFAYKKSIGKISSLKEINKSFVYIIVSLIGLAISGIYGWMEVYLSAYDKTLLGYFPDYFERVFYVYLAVCGVSSFFFMYKKSGEEFENYLVKAFLGTMKASLVYGVMLLGMLCMIWVFEALFFRIYVESFLGWLITGTIAYPAYIIGFSRFEEDLSKFSKVFFGYVLTSLLAVAFVIVYAYIVKIIVTWTFPSNQVYSIMAALFGCGLFIWTAAQGFTEGRLYTALRVFPFLFIPFIVVQIMCISMRVSQYGMTMSRYLGIMLIVFEVLYEIYYAVCFCRKKGLGGVLFPVVLIFVLVFYLVPAINVYSVVTRSQKKVLEQFMTQVNSGGAVTKEIANRAKSSYNTIKDDCSVEGQRYLDKYYRTYNSDKIMEALSDYADKSGYEAENQRYIDICAKYYRDIYDTEGYAHFSNIHTRVYEDIVPNKIPLESSAYEPVRFGYIDLSDKISRLEELGKMDADSDDLAELVKEPIQLENGVLYIDSLTIRYNSSDDSDIEHVYVDGHYLFN
ncbi:DUF4153 domain-containing protein [Butyrivibrio sp. AE3009]|uniref:DUF4153 domain-containing protein n=1 Tax=Butyrivibrio sp. AE3009 TaxID=1280666 RepID=UPI0003B45DD3|nr:DUF4153 domain-containing protein [Butyrivibrio sp. AE3009]